MEKVYDQVLWRIKGTAGVHGTGAIAIRSVSVLDAKSNSISMAVGICHHFSLSLILFVKFRISILECFPAFITDIILLASSKHELQ